MKINCYTKELSAAVSRCASAANGQLSITKGVLMEAADGTVNVTGFNLELGVSAICNSKISEAGSIVIEAKTLSEILKKLPGETVELQADSKNMVQIKGGGAQYSIIGMDAKDFPTIQKFDEGSPIKLPAEVLKNMIRQTVFAVKTDNTVHSGVKFEIEGKELKLVACDGFRLAIRVEQIKDSSEDTSFIVPAKALSEVLKLDGEDILIYKQGNRASFTSDRSAVFSNLLVGEFIDYKKVVPQSFGTLADVQTDEMICAVERVDVIVTDKASPIKIHFAESAALISAQTSIGFASEEVPISLEGTSVTAGYNPKFILDALKACDTDEVKLRIGGAQSPLVIDSPAFLYLILPVRLKEEHTNV